MNLRRIAAFALALCLATAFAAFPFGFIQGFLRSTGHEIPWWTAFGQGIAVPTAAATVIAVLAKRQSDRIWTHAWAVAALGQLLSLPLNVLIAGQSTGQWAAGGLVLLVVIVPIGVLIGRSFYPSPES